MQNNTRSDSRRQAAALILFVTLWFLRKSSAEDDTEWVFKGDQREFPQKQSSVDCRVFVLTAARNLVIQDGVLGDHESMYRWRRRFAHELLVKRATLG